MKSKVDFAWGHEVEKAVVVVIDAERGGSKEKKKDRRYIHNVNPCTSMDSHMMHRTIWQCLTVIRCFSLQRSPSARGIGTMTHFYEKGD
jgi:hypothetical protein